MMKLKSTPPPGITADSIRELTSTSNVALKSSPGTQTPADSTRIPTIKPSSAETQALLIGDYPEAHRPVVVAMQALNGGNIRTEVALRPLHGELRRMGFTNAKQTPPDMVSMATTARVIRCFRDKDGKRVAVLENPKTSRSSSS
jgi:hypothetical protein